jgi:hypothetical protein
MKSGLPVNYPPEVPIWVDPERLTDVTREQAVAVLEYAHKLTLAPAV